MRMDGWMVRWRSAVIGLVALVGGVGPVAEAGPNRYQRYTAESMALAEGAEVLGASLLGGTGTEWLVGGGWQPGGELVLVGTTLGPELTLPGGPTIAVLGEDGPVPGPADGRVEFDGRVPGPLKPVKPGWSHPAGTGFVVLLDAQRRRVVKAVRLPWGSGVVTGGRVDEQGAVYLAGRAGAMPLPAALMLDSVADPGDGGEVAKDLVFLMKLRPDLSVAWTRVVGDSNVGAEVRRGADGAWHLRTNAIHRFGADGQVIDHLRMGIIGGNDWMCEYSPTHLVNLAMRNFSPRVGSLGMVSFWLRVFESGRTRMHLYDWGQLGWIDALQPIHNAAADSAFADEEGHFFVLAYSDGPNSAMARRAYDLTVPHGKRGLGWDVGGAEVDLAPQIRRMQRARAPEFTINDAGRAAMRIANIVKLRIDDGEVVAATRFCGFSPDRGEVVRPRIDRIEAVGDAAVVLAGRMPEGLICTKGYIGGSEGAGGFVTVLSPEMDRLLFSSYLPSTGVVPVRQRGSWRREGFSVIGGVVGGRNRVLVLSSAVRGPVAVTEGAVQRAFGGGEADGFFVEMEVR